MIFHRTIGLCVAALVALSLLGCGTKRTDAKTAKYDSQKLAALVTDGHVVFLRHLHGTTWRVAVRWRDSATDTSSTGCYDFDASKPLKLAGGQNVRSAPCLRP